MNENINMHVNVKNSQIYSNFKLPLRLLMKNNANGGNIL